MQVVGFSLIPWQNRISYALNRKPKKGGQLNEIESYEKVLNNISPKQWPAFLKEHAFVSGNRINIELAETFARVGTLMDFKRFVCIDHVEAPDGSTEAFLTYCGVLGYGTYLSKYYDQGLLDRLRIKANDPRLTIRKAVDKALQYIGGMHFQRLVHYLDEWKNGTPLEQRACLAAVCSPKILSDWETLPVVMELLEWITATFAGDINWNQDYEVLQEELARCWARVVIGNPVKGKQKMERWMKEQHPMVKTIMTKSLLNDSLQSSEHKWANEWLGKVRKIN